VSMRTRMRVVMEAMAGRASEDGMMAARREGDVSMLKASAHAHADSESVCVHALACT